MNPGKGRIALNLRTLKYFINVVFDLVSDGRLLILRGASQLEAYWSLLGAVGNTVYGPRLQHSLERQRTVISFEDRITCLQGKESCFARQGL